MANPLHRSRSIAVPAAFGLALCLCTVTVHLFLAGLEYGDGLADSSLELGWLLAGAALLGAIPAVAWVRYQLRTPILVSGGGYLLSLVTSWPNLVDSARSAGVSATMTMFELVLTLWALLLAVALFCGFVEYLLRPSLRRYAPVLSG
ncbi:hypothetical protein [Halostagnicola kamekurae]|uniref:Uncharacterized protein n=1 Tax=Halostagnicola kamekurae TaxID=619731 RepID=A0A1I6U3V8_9EURY|nr:hypothetical protein [Halostagnicola kamekurae]SFS96143.1 hypothetical protein SAMN04488556_3529 [Halostagnicola kamekurae]